MTTSQKMINEDEIIDLDNDTEETVNDTVEIIEEEEVDVEALKKQNATLQAQKDHWKKKFDEKGETSKEKPKAEVKDGNLSQTDLIAILKANVAEDDIEEIAEYAKLKRISISEALKTNVVKSILNDKEEQRNVARATNTGNVRRVGSKVADDVLLEKAQTGVFPDSDADLVRLIKARKGIK